MDRAFVAQRVQDKLHRVEAAIEAAMKEGSELLALTIEAKSELGLSSTVGATETAQVIRVIESLGVAHQSATATHTGLGRIARRLGVPTRATGVWKDEAAFDGERATLHRAG